MLAASDSIPMPSEPHVEREIARFNWSELRVAMGKATDVPSAIRALLRAQSVKEADAAYWRLENVVVVQGNLYEAALPCVTVLLAALRRADRPAFVTCSLLELLFQIVNGEVHMDERTLGNLDLDKRCRRVAREGQQSLMFVHGMRTPFGEGRPEAVKDIIDAIERGGY